MIDYEPLACYIFDRGYWDLARLFRIEQNNSFFILREKRNPEYEIVAGEDLLEEDNIIRDQTVRFTSKRNRENYPAEIRRIVAYIPEKKHTYTFYTNNFYLTAEQIVLLYKHRWQVELFLKWIKQHLRVTTFWGNSETAVRIQIYAAICTYCMVAILERQMKLERNIYEVMSILDSSLLVKEHLKDLLKPDLEPEKPVSNQWILPLESD